MFLYSEYINLFLSVIFVSFLGLFLFSLSYFLIIKYQIIEKLSIYECGFEPFEDVRLMFDVKFYLIAILFIIFDLEITFLFPWVLISGFLNFIGIFIFSWFLLLLGLVFIYEWLLGALDW